MIVQPLIFGSTERGAVKGYQLLARYAGIDDQAAQEFCRWAPSHQSLQSSSVDAESLSFFPVSEDMFAVARSIYGGPEYSGRGGLQVVTLALIISRHQFVNYDNDPFQVLTTAKALGHLLLPATTPQNLKTISLPRRPVAVPAEPLSDEHRLLARDTAKKLVDGRRVVVVGKCNPTTISQHVFETIRSTDRTKISVSTGLKLSSRREFQLQFVTSADPASRAQWSRQQITCLTAADHAVLTA